MERRTGASWSGFIEQRSRKPQAWVYAVLAFLLAVVAARVSGSASFVAARRLNRLLEPLTNSSSAARSVTRSSEAMSFSERARVSVFAPVAFGVCVVVFAFAIVVISISLRGGGR